MEGSVVEEEDAGDDIIYEEGVPEAAASIMEVEMMEPEEKLGPSLGRVLGWIIVFNEFDKKYSTGIGTIIFIIFYILGMSFKLYKIYRGDYIEEEPVFMKYK